MPDGDRPLHLDLLIEIASDWFQRVMKAMNAAVQPVAPTLGQPPPVQPVLDEPQPPTVQPAAPAFCQPLQ
jgi:hypothetical protein